MCLTLELFFFFRIVSACGRKKTVHKNGIKILRIPSTYATEYLFIIRPCSQYSYKQRNEQTSSIYLRSATKMHYTKVYTIYTYYTRDEHIHHIYARFAKAIFSVLTKWIGKVEEHFFFHLILLLLLLLAERKFHLIFIVILCQQCYGIYKYNWYYAHQHAHTRSYVRLVQFHFYGNASHITINRYEIYEFIQYTYDYKIEYTLTMFVKTWRGLDNIMVVVHISVGICNT